MKKAIIVGVVKRLAKEISPARMQISVYADTTTIGDETFNVKELVTFEIGTFSIEKQSFLATLCNLSVNDKVKVTFVEKGNDWEVVDIVNEPELGRTIADWFKDVQEDMEHWKNKNK